MTLSQPFYNAAQRSRNKIMADREKILRFFKAGGDEELAGKLIDLADQYSLRKNTAAAGSNYIHIDTDFISFTEQSDNIGILLKVIFF